MLSNTKPTYAVMASMPPSGTKLTGNKTDAHVTAFSIEDPEVQSRVNTCEDQVPTDTKKREKSMSMQQITKGITLKTKVSEISDTPGAPGKFMQSPEITKKDAVSSEDSQEPINFNV